MAVDPSPIALQSSGIIRQDSAAYRYCRAALRARRHVRPGRFESPRASERHVPVAREVILGGIRFRVTASVVLVCLLAAIQLWSSAPWIASASQGDRTFYKDAAIGSLRLLSSPDSQAPQTTYPPGTTAIYASFVYADAEDDEVGLTVTGRGALNLFQYSGRYTGSGSETIELDGTSLTVALAVELEDSAQAARADARRAAAQAFGVQEYLLSAHYGLQRADSALDLMEGAQIGGEGAAIVYELRTEVAAALERMREAIRVPMEEEERKKDLAREADEPLTLIASRAGELARLVEGLSDLPIPQTPPFQKYAYAVELQVGGLPVAVQEFLVAEVVPVYLPYCRQP